MRVSPLWFAAALALAVACRGKEAPAPVATASLPEVSAPAGLVAELSLGNPKETWSRLLRAGGSFAQALPSSLPVLLATSLSLPPAAAGTLDESVPFVGAVLSQAGSSEPDLVLGVHVTSGPELVASLTLGDAAKFRRVELAPRVVRLVSAPGAPELDGALGVSGNYLLVASRVDALRDAGRFVAESVPKRARSEPGFTLSTSQGVVGGALSRRLRDLWQSRRAALAERARAERQAKGRPADFADPEALLAGADGVVDSWLAVLDSSKALSLNLSPEVDRFRAELALTPGAAGAAALLSKDLAVGSIAPLLALPQKTSAALLLRGDAAGHPGEPSTLADSLTKLFGARLNPEQATKMTNALGNFGQAHHGASVVALVPLPAPSMLLTFETRDAEAFSRSLGDVISLVQLPPVSGWLAGVWGKPQLVLAAKPTQGVYRARVRFQRGAAARSALPPALSLSWQAKDGVGQLLISADEATGFAALTELPRLEQASWFGSAELGQGEHTAAALVADARLLAAGTDDAPLLASFGKKGEQIVVTLDVATAALPALARVFALDRSP
ncbi:MAG TPA: hypothetical protein VHB79_14415 [Polyangiaceae bacterium]|nr:hypothetical protein [Polyangiaceae bacterium]